jgi:hypothetical protein
MGVRTHGEGKVADVRLQPDAELVQIIQADFSIVHALDDLAA